MDRLVVNDNLFFERNIVDKAGPNDNMLLIGSSGRGKSSCILDQNLVNGGEGSVIISDPKGMLYKRYHQMFCDRGYEIKILDFNNPERSDGYNPFLYVKSNDDIRTVIHLMGESHKSSAADPFWNIMAFHCMLIFRKNLL